MLSDEALNRHRYVNTPAGRVVSMVDFDAPDQAVATGVGPTAAEFWANGLNTGSSVGLLM